MQINAPVEEAIPVAAAPRSEALVPLPHQRTTLLCIATIALVFFAASVAYIATDNESTLLARLDSGGEANLPTWFASALWAWAALLAFSMGEAARRLGDAVDRRWTLLGVLFALLSIDEAAQLHEETVGPLMDGVESVTGLDGAGAKLIAVAVIGAVLVALAVWLWPWLRSLSGRLRLRLLFAGAVFVSGSLGLEVISRLADSSAAEYLSPLEELCEMLGVGLLVVTLLPAARGVLARTGPDPA
jgi:hypothetical protein